MLWCLAKSVPSPSLSGSWEWDWHLIAETALQWRESPHTVSCPMLRSTSHPVTVDEKFQVQPTLSNLGQHCRSIWLQIFPLDWLRPLSWLHCNLTSPLAQSWFFLHKYVSTTPVLHTNAYLRVCFTGNQPRVVVKPLEIILGHRILKPININIPNSKRWTKNC